MRPLPVDIATFVLPILMGAGLFALGRTFRRWPLPVRGIALIGAVVTVALGLLTLTRLLPFEIERAAFLVGGMRTALCAAGTFLLGVVWGVPGRSTSSSFLFTLAGVALVVMGIEGSGRLWWRHAPGTWDRTVGPAGVLVQSSSVTCAPTAAAMLLHQVGIVAGEGEMAYHAGTSPIGSEPAGVIRALEAKAEPHGWRVAAHRTTYDECIGSGPFLAHVREGLLGHALTVIAVTPEGVQVLDPADGLRHTIPRARFESDWDGMAVRLTREN